MKKIKISRGVRRGRGENILITNISTSQAISACEQTE